MENKEFNLSEKIKETNVIGEYFIPKDVKEFIRVTKEPFKDGMLFEGSSIKNIIDINAGAELNGI